MKKLLTVFVLLSSFLLFPQKAEAATDSVDDQAGLFTPEEVSSLNSEIDAVNKQFKGSLYIVTTNSNSEEVEDYAEEYLGDKIGAHGNGAIMVLDMGQRMMHIATYGNMLDFISEKRHDKIYDETQAAMKQDDYYGAAEAFVSMNKEYIEAGIPGKKYHLDAETGAVVYEKNISLFEGGIAFAVASVAALAFFFINRAKYQLKWGKEEYDYRGNSALDLTARSDDFVNSFVTTRHIPRNNNNNGGGGGGDFGGGGSSRSF